MEKQDAEQIFRLIGMITQLLEDHKVKEIKISLVRDYVQRLIEVFPIIYIREKEETVKPEEPIKSEENTAKDTEITQLKETIEILKNLLVTKDKTEKRSIPYKYKHTDEFLKFIEEEKKKLNPPVKTPKAIWYKSWSDNDTHIYVSDHTSDMTPQFTYNLAKKQASYVNNGVSYSIQ